MTFWDRFKFKKKPFKELKSDVKDRKSEVGRQVSEQVGATPSREHTGDAYRVLVRPLVTEKTARLAARGQYGFIVSPRANKHDIARAVRAVYGVEPIAVTVATVRGKAVRFGQISGRRKETKKAMVTLPPGHKIAVYEGV